MAPPRKCDCGVCRLCQRRVYLRGYYRRKQVEQVEQGAKLTNGSALNGHQAKLTYQDLNEASVRERLRSLIDQAVRARQGSW